MSILVKHKRTEPAGDLFNWQAADEDFQPLPGTVKYVVSEPAGLGDDSYQHHSLVFYFYGKRWFARTTAEYDEEQPGMHTVLYSSDDGKTWTYEGEVLPAFSPEVRRYPVSMDSTGRINYPTQFVPIDDQLYLICEVNDRDFTGGGNVRTPSGVLAVSIDSDGTIGTPVWVHNYSTLPVRRPPFTGEDHWYLYDYNLREKILAYINRPNYFPKILFSWPSVWSVVDSFEGDGLGEPVSIQPIGYEAWWKYWKTGAPGYKQNKVGQVEEDGSFFNSSVPEDTNSTATRFINYNQNTIILCGNSEKTDRNELFVAVARKQNNGKFRVDNEDVYSLTGQNRVDEIYEGHGKGGGEQLPDLFLLPNRKLMVGFDIAKDTCMYCEIDLTKIV